MDDILSALADNSRWRIMQLLAERPRSVGETAELIGLRQPQTTKHLQTLARAGLVKAFSLGQRRVYTLEAAPLFVLQRSLQALLNTSETNRSQHDAIARYQAAIDSDSALATGERWADGRSFYFQRMLAASRESVWRHWVDPTLLGCWWVPPSMAIVECELEAIPGGRAVLEYRDAEGRYRSEGVVLVAQKSEHLVFQLSVLDESGSTSFTGHYSLTLSDAGDHTALELTLRITETTVAALAYIAGIETGWTRVLDQLVAAIDVK